MTSARIFPTMDEAKAAPVIWTEGIICAAVARYVEYWRNTVVPNVYIGGGYREIDLAVLTKSGMLWAFEVKVSVADWKRDLHKSKYRACVCPARFYYVVPSTLVKWSEPTPRPALDADVAVRKAWWAGGRLARPAIPEWVPAHAGIVFLNNHRDTYTNDNGTVTVVDSPKQGYVHPCKPLHRKPLDAKYQAELLRKLGMRYWSHVAPVDLPQEVTAEAV